MPKIKKQKISLVSAYESGADSELETGSESDISECESSKSGSKTRSVSRETSESRSRSNSRTEVETEKQEIISDESDEMKQEEIKIIESVNETEINNLQESVKSEEQNESVQKCLFSLENGFLPGCENIKLPPAPKASCSQTLQNKIIQVLDRMKTYNYSINSDIKNRKNFKNPSIYEKLIEANGIDEFGSSFETHIEDLKSNGYMFYDELDQAQMAEWAKRDKERKERTKIEMVTGTKKK